MTEYDDAEVERRVRASLDTHAGEMDTSVPVAARARAAARRHRGRWVAAGAAVAVAAIAVTAVVIDRADPPSSEAPPVATPSPAPSVMPDGWRTEYWHDVSVQVPADWGWGAGPREKSMARCGELVDPATPYVGRPIMLSDVCVIEKPPSPAAPYVWFDAPVEPGTVDLPNGYEQETVEVDGTTVTVGSDDQALRARILASVARQDLCPTTVDASGLDLGSGIVEGRDEPESYELCAYSNVGDEYELVYGRELAPATFGRFDRALDRAPERVRICETTTDLVVLTAMSSDVAAQSWVADLACKTVASSGGMRKLTTGVERSWPDAGVRASLRSSNPWLS